MSDIAIRVDGLGKRYRIGARQQYRTLRDTLAAPWRWFRRDGEERHIWALKDVSFEVKRGEVVGVIGRNGAGKSTLLKILSRITDPTEGRAEVRGRVRSLLEVGTGFHPELTGRENIFLNGAILGMRRREIEAKFDEIVSFAEIEKFLDTPVKHYSSGMYVRLAFSVAAHLEPDVLLVDEVLAVGDSRFQKRCLGKLGEVSRSGRTVLLVSHNMATIARLCPRTMVLDEGRIQHDGPSPGAIRKYLDAGFGSAARREWNLRNRAPGDEAVRLWAVRVRDERGRITETIDIRRGLSIEVEYEVLLPDRIPVPNLHLFNEDGICIFVTADTETDVSRRPVPPGRYLSTVRIPGNFLSEGTVFVTAAISSMNPVVVHACERDAVAFQIVDTLDGDSARGTYGGPMPGVVRPLLQWSRRPLSSETETGVKV